MNDTLAATSSGAEGASLTERLQGRFGGDKLLRGCRIALLLLLALWVCFSIAKLILLLLPEPDLPRLPPVSVAGSTAGDEGNPTTGVQLDQLQALNLFGEVGAVVTTSAPAQTLAMPEVNAEDTKLNLQLRGVVMSPEQASARAIIANGSKQDLYAVGDVLPVGRNVKLSRVMAERVILDNNGNAESLWLYDESNKSASRSAAAPRYRAEPVRSGDQTQRGFIPNNDQAQHRFMSNDDPDGTDVTDALAQATGSKSLTDVVKLSVARREGQVIGYSVRPGRDADLFRDLGLEAGDIVTSINGIYLDSSSKVMQVYRELKDQNTATLTLLRGDEELTMDISL